MRFFVCFISFILLSSLAFTEDKNIGKNFFKNKSKIPNPFSLKDPFEIPKFDAAFVYKDKGLFKKDESTYSNRLDINLEEIILTDLKVIGTIVGKYRRAMVKIRDKKEIISLKEGMRIGPENAELKAILPGGIVLVEKMTNVYGEQEYLETVIPISK